METKYNYTHNKKSPQTGSLVFEALKRDGTINPDSNIYLVGFTSVDKQGKLYKEHSNELEHHCFETQKKFLRIYNM